MYKARDKGSGDIVALKVVRLDEDDEVCTYSIQGYVIMVCWFKGCAQCCVKGGMSLERIKTQEYSEVSLYHVFNH